LAAGLLYRPPIAIIAPAPALDLSKDVKITGLPTQKLHGRYLLVAVTLHQPNAFGALWAMLDSKKESVPIAALVPKGVSETEFDRLQKGMFAESQQLAAAAAARAEGLPVTSTGTGATVLQVVDTAPAAKVLRPGDVITEIDGTKIGLATDLKPLISSHPPGAKLDVVFERKGKTRHASVSTIKLPHIAEMTAAIGVLAETRGLKVDLPFKIHFKEHKNIGGPSAGLSYALVVADLLDSADLARGRTIAASGTISLDGRVGEVGGLNEKAVAAARAGASLLVVPTSEAKALKTQSLKIRGARTLVDALGIVRS